MGKKVAKPCPHAAAQAHQKPAQQHNSMEQKGKDMRVQRTIDDGTTAHKAIIVHNISDEYAWSEHHYPDGMVVMQRVTYRDGKPFDILTLRSANGDEQDVYFDI